MRISLLFVAAALMAACAAIDTPGTYQAISKAAAREDGERYVRVTLKPDGNAAVSSTYSAHPSKFLAEGTWQRDGNRVAVQLPNQKPLVFQRAGEQLLTREWDRALLGEPGPELLVRQR